MRGLRAACLVVLATSCGDINAAGGGNTPVPVSIAPTMGSTVGGQLVAITGSGFGEGTAVLFDGVPARDVTVMSSGVITAVTPPHEPGTVTVTVYGSGGQSAEVPTPYEYVRSFDGEGRPRLVSAISTSNTGVRVIFSEPVSDGTENPENFSIGHANVNPESAYLRVDSASLSEDGIAVDLVTGSQNEVIYELAAANIRDLDGNLLAPPELLVNPSVVNFAGTPPSAEEGTLVDTDGDGLSDNAEMNGWTVTVFLSNGDISQSTRTSDPTQSDTDDDGLTDDIELLAGSNPRSSDTDGDGVPDEEEWNVWRCDPTHQDTDEDGLPDSADLEFETSPILDDTDGDGFGDYEELFELNRNPLLADLPLPHVVVTQFDLQLETKYSYTDESGTVQSESVIDTTSVSQARATSLSQSDTRSVQTTNTNSQSVGAEVGYDNGFSAKVTGSASFEQSSARGYTASIDRTTATESQASQEQSVGEAFERSELRSVTKVIESASIVATVNVANDSDVPFTLTNLEVSVLRQDRAGGGQFRPVATLVPSSGTDLALNLGPLDGERGPIIFENTDIFPNLVEAIMREPNGLVFKVANFDVVDEEGRNFAFTSAEVNSRTAGVTIDFGDGRVESRRVATHNRFTPDGRPMGISIARAFELLGYTLDAPGDPIDEVALGAPTPVTRFSIGTSVNREGVERLIRVGDVQNDFDPADPEKRFWAVRTNDETLPEDTDFSALSVNAGDELLLFYTADVDEDGLFDREELLYGSSDQVTDTDGDGLDDFEEIREGWMVQAIPGSPRRVFPSPARSNSDLDALTDAEERLAGTDPNRGDTDLDGLKDDFELNETIRIALFDGDADETNNPILAIVPYTDVVLLVDGGDGAVSTSAIGDDAQLEAVGDTVAPGTAIVGPGPNGIVDTWPSGDDLQQVERAIDGGSPTVERLCDTAAAAGDVQVTAVGATMLPGSTCVAPGSDGVLDTAGPSGNDSLIRLSEVRAVSGGAVATAATGDDVQMAAVGATVATGNLIIAPGANGILETIPALGGIAQVRSMQYVTAGPETEVPAVCETVAAASDEQVTAVGSPMPPGSACVRAGSDGTLETVPSGDDYQRAVHYGLYALDPLRRDTDEDGIPDGREIAVGTNPNRPDRNRIIDTDQDGLFDVEETEGWPVTVDGVTARAPGTSNPNAADTDSDGLPDVFEWAVGTNPRVRDTDGDSLTDLQEFYSDFRTTYYNAAQIELAERRCAAASACTVPSAPAADQRGGNALSVDSDGDTRSDGEEFLVSWTVRVDGQSPYEVRSDINSPNVDGDGWDDFQELVNGTDPNEANTDGDSTLDGFEPAPRSPLRKDKLVTLHVPSRITVVGDCDAGSDGASAWEGAIYATWPGVASEQLRFGLGRCNGVSEGIDCSVDGALAPFLLLEGQSFSYRASAIREDDLVGGSDLTGITPQFDNSVTYGTATSTTVSSSFTASETYCELRISARWTVQ